MYAATRLALRETPALQCTNTLPFFSLALMINALLDAKCSAMLDAVHNKKIHHNYKQILHNTTTTTAALVKYLLGQSQILTGK
jgi:hypothetical protein